MDTMMTCSLEKYLYLLTHSCTLLKSSGLFYELNFEIPERVDILNEVNGGNLDSFLSCR